MFSHDLFCQYRTSRDLSNEESHLDQYCQMFCILLEQTKFHCCHTTCLVSADPDETSQTRGLTWISTVRCSAYSLNKFISNFTHDLFGHGHCRTRGDLSNEEAHINQYSKMLCILLEQTQFQCPQMTCFASLEPDETSQMRSLTWTNTISLFCILLEQNQFQCSHMTCLVSMEPDGTSQMRSLTWINTVRCSAYCLNKLSSSGLT